LRQRGDVELDSISLEDVQAYLKGRKTGGPITCFWFAKYQALDRLFSVRDQSGLYGTPGTAANGQAQETRQPYLYAVEEVHRLLSVGDACYRPTSLVEPRTVRTLILLLYGAGLRIGEALKLTLSDMNLNDALLTIRESKFHKSRLVPIGRDLTGALWTYHEQQWGASDPAPHSPFLCTRKHMPVKFFQAK
jgi:integrase/recombinase XerD